MNFMVAKWIFYQNIYWTKKVIWVSMATFQKQVFTELGISLYLVERAKGNDQKPKPALEMR